MSLINVTFEITCSALNLSGLSALPFAFAIASSAMPTFTDASVRQLTACVVAGSSFQVKTTLSGKGVGMCIAH